MEDILDFGPAIVRWMVFVQEAQARKPGTSGLTLSSHASFKLAPCGTSHEVTKPESLATASELPCYNLVALLYSCF